MGRWKLSVLATSGLVVGGIAYPVLAQTVHTVELVGIIFLPADINVNVGDTVHWVWDSVLHFHNVESGIVVSGIGIPDGNFISGAPTLTATFDLIFDQDFLDVTPMPGNVYPYYCIVHAFANMIGSITVVRPGDIDGDFDVDLIDHKIASGCMTGPGEIAQPVICTQEELDRADSDSDGDIDLKDLAAMQLAFTG